MDKFDMDMEELLNEQERRTGRSARGVTAQLKRNRSTLIAGAAFLAAIILLIVCVKMSFAADKKKVSDKAANVNNSLADTKSGEQNETSEIAENPSTPADSGVYTGLYMIDEGSGLYSYDYDENYGLTIDYPIGTVSGLYTGIKNPDAPETLIIAYKNERALVYAENAIKIENAKVLPLGAISQHTAWGGGESGCAVACLAMIMDGDYESMLEKGDYYADQGSLSASSGGMTYDAMAAFCKDMYGRELKNAYSEDELPSVTIKRLIDEGRYAIVLVRMSNNYISGDGIVNHFIVVNGYIEQDGEIDFIYANSYYYDYGGGIALRHIDPDMIDEAANFVYDEPRTVAYIE